MNGGIYKVRLFMFRAWLPFARKMIDHDQIAINEGKVFERVYYESTGFMNQFPRPDAILMQNTGIKDKNGKWIYEGDILSTDLSRPYLVVEFRNGCFMYQCHDSGKDYYDIMLPIEVEHDQDTFAEVIGNTYENPDLLKEEVK